MPSGYYLSDGVTDLDSVFEAESGGNGVSVSGYVRKDNGAPLRYAAVANGSPIASNTGYYLSDGTTDFRSVWAAKGSVANLVSSLAFNGGSYHTVAEAVAWDNLLYSDIAVYINADGTGRIVRSSTNYTADNVSAYLSSGVDNFPNGSTLSSFNWSSNPHSGVGSGFRCYVTPTLQEVGWIDYPTTPSNPVYHPASWSIVQTQLETETSTGRQWHAQFFSLNAVGMRNSGGMYCSAIGVYKNVSASFTGMSLYGVDYGNPQALGSNVKIGSQFQAVGNSGSVNYKDNNAGLSWYYKVNYTVTIQSNDGAHSVTGTFSVIHELRWQATSYTVPSGGGGGGGCVVTDSFMYDGSQALQWGVRDSLFITDPYVGKETSNSVYGEIRLAETEIQPCYEIETRGGAFLRCSSTAPIPTEDAGFLTPEHLVGKRVPVTTREKLDQASAQDSLHDVDFDWDEVVNVRSIGLQFVRKIFIDNRCFWASMDGKLFILHHNLKASNP